MSHFLKMLLGWTCYQVWTRSFNPGRPQGRFINWMLSWAGYYAYEEGGWFRASGDTNGQEVKS